MTRIASACLARVLASLLVDALSCRLRQGNCARRRVSCAQQLSRCVPPFVGPLGCLRVLLSWRVATL
eukprot:11247001-Alexandrium_andersonii.AAC.1